MTHWAANPGGICCMYCGTKHSSKLDCRVPCSICQKPGTPWTKLNETVVLCWDHRPDEKEWTVGPCEPPKFVFSKTTLLEGFKHSSSILWREDGKTPYREFSLSEKLIPLDAKYLEGDWEVTVRFTPKMR